VFGFKSLCSIQLLSQLALDFDLWDAHINHVRNHFDGSLNRTRIKIRFVANGALKSQLFKPTRKVIYFPLHFRCVNMGQSQKQVNTGPHHTVDEKDRL
jgi:hypothetical protein